MSKLKKPDQKRHLFKSIPSCMHTKNGSPFLGRWVVIAHALSVAFGTPTMEAFAIRVGRKRKTHARRFSVFRSVLVGFFLVYLAVDCTKA